MFGYGLLVQHSFYCYLQLAEFFLASNGPFGGLNCYLYLQLSFTILALVVFFWGMAKTFLGWQQKEIVYAGKTLTQESSMSSHLTRWNKCLNNYNELSKLLQIRFSIN